MSIKECEAITEQLGIAEFDLLLIGDGSGTLASTPCGWACLAYHRPFGQIARYFGGSSHGTNVFAELSPYFHALHTFHCIHNKDHCRVAIVSDSEVTVRCGNGRYERRANAALWAGIAWFEKNGYSLSWYHVPRNSNPVSEACDRVAGNVRKLLLKGQQWNK